MDKEPIEKSKACRFKYKQEALVFFLAWAFFLGTSLFNLGTQAGGFTKWLSPDETANYAFTKQFALTGQLAIDEPLNPKVDDIVHPRSMMVDGEEIKPMSFLGMVVLYGAIARVAGVEVIPYLTPLVGALGLVAFYFLAKRLFDRRIALIAAALLATFPPYIYFSSRSMFHNVPFLVFGLFGLLFAVAMNQGARQRWPSKFVWPALSGLFFGLAATTRTSELLWLAPTLFLLWLFNFRSLGLTKPLLWLAFFVVGALPAAYYSQVLHGSPIATGYAQMNRSIEQLGAAGSQLIGSGITQTSLWQKVRDLVFYFGFNPHQTFKMGYNYFFNMFFWLFWLAVLGAVIFLVQFRKIKKRQFLFLLALAAFGLLLFFYYGSWEFYDNPDPAAATLGNSYTRYWLPIYLGAILLGALAINRLSRLLPRRNLRHAFRLLLTGIFMLSGLTFVLTAKDEGLIESYYKQRLARDEWQRVLALTEKDAVIITKYHDKLFFPERKVVYGLFDDDRMNLSYAKLARLAPLYYYNFTFPDNALAYLNRSKLAQAGLGIKKIQSLNPTFTLYKLEPAAAPSPASVR